MDIPLMIIVIGAFALGLVLIGYVLHRKKLAKALEKAKEESRSVVESSRRKADELIQESLREAKEKAKKQRRQFEQEAKEKRRDYLKLEQKTRNRERVLDEKAEVLAQRESAVDETEKSLQLREKKYTKKAAHLEELIEENQKILEKTAQMSAREAKEVLMQSVEEQARQEAKKTIARIEEEAQRTAQHKSQYILSLAIQRGASEFVGDATVTVVSLPGEEMKGRIIGREGRNIRALEHATGVDVIIDDTPEAVILSCFNPVRREIAKIALERLMEDGRIHPARIEEVAAKVTQEFDQTLKDYGTQAAYDVGVADLHPHLLTHLGHLRFKIFGKRSLLQHAVETAKIAGLIAQCVGLPVKLAQRAGLLHDIGKGMDQEEEGHHAVIGAKLCARYGEHEDIVHAIEQHVQEDPREQTLLTICLSAANILSQTRIDGHHEHLGSYIKRLDDMEAIASSYEGVEKAIAFQAGREMRVVIDPDKVADEDMGELSQKIATRIREDLTFPGRVKVMLLRESTYVDYAQ